MDSFNILPRFTGCLIHDFWKPYLKYDTLHALCNAHLLRELQSLHENQNQPWADDMSNLLLNILSFTQKYKDTYSKLTEYFKKTFIDRYRYIISKGHEANPVINTPASNPIKRGRPKKTKAQNLLHRLDTYEPYVLAFLHDFTIPFTNNQAEQDIRMIKVRQKISGCFRTYSLCR